MWGRFGRASHFIYFRYGNFHVSTFLAKVYKDVRKGGVRCKTPELDAEVWFLLFLLKNCK